MINDETRAWINCLKTQRASVFTFLKKRLVQEITFRKKQVGQVALEEIKQIKGMRNQRGTVTRILLF